VLKQHRGRISEAAVTLGIQRTNLYRKMRSLESITSARHQIEDAVFQKNLTSLSRREVSQLIHLESFLDVSKEAADS
jgi:hypothetical protein